MEEKFSFVIAKKWRKNEPASFSNLGIYTYGEDIHTGTIEIARELLAYVQRKNPDEKYHIYKITGLECVE